MLFERRSFGDEIPAFAASKGVDDERRSSVPHGDYDWPIVGFVGTEPTVGESMTSATTAGSTRRDPELLGRPSSLGAALSVRI